MLMCLNPLSAHTRIDSPLIKFYVCFTTIKNARAEGGAEKNLEARSIKDVSGGLRLLHSTWGRRKRQQAGTFENGGYLLVLRGLTLEHQGKQEAHTPLSVYPLFWFTITCFPGPNMFPVLLEEMKLGNNL